MWCHLKADEKPQVKKKNAWEDPLFYKKLYLKKEQICVYYIYLCFSLFIEFGIGMEGFKKKVSYCFPIISPNHHGLTSPNRKNRGL